MLPRRWTRHALVAALVGAVVSLGFHAPEAQASSTILCKGFTACEAAGYSSFGYGPTNYKKMWWRMYAGHNCTNYVAYRMIKAGMPSERPWSGSGDARNWGVVFKSKTNQTPMIGSVAWWSSNHVAYVQRIIDADTIVISEDHYRGDFDWRKITRSGGGWPTGFIHLVDEAVKPTSPPVVTGTPKVDETLTAKPGTWNRTGATFAYQWLRNGKAIAGATATTYTPGPTEVGAAYTVKVTASKAGFRSGSSSSTLTDPTVPGTMDVDGEATVAGIPKVGATLTATVPDISPAPEEVQYGWFADGKYIPGGSGTSITLGPAQLGKVIRFVARGSRTGYDDARASSVPTAEVGPEKLTLTKEPALTGNPYVGKPYTVSAGAVTPSATTSFQWFGNGAAIPGATRATYTPTLSDPGVRLSVRVSYTKPGYTTIVRELKPKQAVHQIGWIYVTSTAHKSVTVQVVAEGIPVVSGQVVLIGRTGVSQTLTLKNGKATFTPDWLYAGSRPLTVKFLGSNKVDPRTRAVTVAVK